jgi:ribonuclease R
MVHVSELGTEYFQFNEAAHELRGERTGRRFRLTDELHVQVSRVDLEARRIEFRLVQRVGFRDVIAARAVPASRDKAAKRKAAPPMTEQARSARAARAEGSKRASKGAASSKRHGGGKRKRRH